MADTCETVKLTKRAVDAAVPLTLKDGTVRQRLYLDTNLTGFGLCVGAKARSYFAQRFVNGKSVRITIGRNGVYTVGQARKQAQQLLAQMARGENPVEEKRKAAARGITLKEALDLSEQTLKTRGRSEKTIGGYRYSIETYLTDWLNRPLAEITRHDARSRHQKIAADVAAGKYSNGRERNENHGKHTANAALVSFRAVYNRALREHPELPANPCINVDFFKIERHGALPVSELHKWHKSVLGLENSIRRDFLIFTLHTGLRRKSASEAAWSHVNFDGKVLHVPNPKGGRAFDLPLTDLLVKLLRERQRDNEMVFEKSPWIFPAESESGHISEPREEFDGIQWSPHDMRRWFITAAESIDTSPYVIKALVNHSLPSGDVTAGYIQHEVERLRPAMEAIGDKLRTLCESPQGKVLRFKSKQKAS
jgi:integrase